MRRYVAAFALVGFLATLAAGQHALAQDTVDNTRRSMGNLRPNPPAAQGSNRTIIVVPQPYYGGYGYPHYQGYRPYYPGGYGYYPAPYPYYRGPYVYPPVYVQPGTLYGARALRRFMGVGW